MADAPAMPLSGTPLKDRFLGVDVARGVALLSMLAANIFVVVYDDGADTPTLAGMTVTGRSATMFVTVAGISLAFLTGGRHPMDGRSRRAAAVGIAVRALAIGAIGLAVGYVAGSNLNVILPYYALFFLLAIPFVDLRPRTLAIIAGGLAVIGPLILLWASYLGFEGTDGRSVTFTDAVTNPTGFVLELFLGSYPAVVYMVYVLAGMAIGRLDLSSTVVATRLMVGGLVMAVVAWVVSSVILFKLGGLQQLIDAAGPETDPKTITNDTLWDAGRVDSWWWLAIRSHHAATPIDAVHSLGCAIAVLGIVLLVTKLPIGRHLLWPVGVAGAMTLTIYSTHALVQGSGWLLDDHPIVLYVLSVAGALVFAVLWRHFFGQGPLERVVSLVSGRARRAAMGWRWTDRSDSNTRAGGR
ncbi:heparan-alpha-glucosaminide N-acetyltransferase domain-containing protein [Pseudonocardia aurantiaca]|uniref:Heparan-alpha-glucosaminide N-acetyltransferase domain-containing protein n=1 Tax=Pseudonocardia aurantiaca TaxID=75290 RepID=A0ABW4FEH8_9PSEU